MVAIQLSLRIILKRSAVFLNVTSMAAICIFFGPSSANAQLDKDQITLRDGSRISGQITSYSSDQLTVTEAGASNQIAVEKITRLILSDDPSGLSAVRGYVESGQLEQASRRISGIEAEAGSRDIVQQDIAFYQALVKARLAMQGTGDLGNAARQMVDFLKKNPRSFRFYSACEVLGDLAMNLGRYETAARYYGRLEQAASDEWKARGRLLQGRSWLRQGEPQKAMTFFQQSVSTADDRIQALGQVGLAVCQAEQGQPQAGIALLEKIIAERDVSDTELFARAYNALGRCYEAAQEPEDALLAYLHTDMLFNRETDAHAEALFHLSQLWSAVNKPAEATKAKQLLKQRYATSPWAKL